MMIIQPYQNNGNFHNSLNEVEVFFPGKSILASRARNDVIEDMNDEMYLM